MDPHSGDFSSLRESMVHDQLIARGITSERVLRAFRSVSRRAFVRPEDDAHAYEDHPLAIGYSQTISQPYMVATMLEALDLRGSEKILEIGTGSGYETALLSHLARSVHTVERIPELAEEARHRLGRLGHKNIHFHLGDGTLGWPECAPYDAIIVSAGAPRCPPALRVQVVPGGRLVIPIGPEHTQELWRYTRVAETPAAASWREENLGACVFVKLIGEQGW